MFRATSRMFFFKVVLLMSLSLTCSISSAYAVSDNVKVRRACYGEEKDGSITCLRVCRNLTKSHSSRQPYRDLTSINKNLCLTADRQNKKEKMTTDSSCKSGRCTVRFAVVDPYADQLRYKGASGYSLIKTYKNCKSPNVDCTSSWELLTPSGNKSTFEKCAKCKTIKFVSGDLKGASLVNSGGQEGEDVLLRFVDNK